MELLREFLHLINEMSPFLLLGFLIAGVLHAFVPASYYTRYLSRRSFGSVVNAALFGIPLPLCSCGVIPAAMGLRRDGASKGAVTSFLIATPQTGVDSVIATYSLMGLPFALLRPVAALVTALFGGALVNAVDDGSENEKDDDCDDDDCCSCDGLCHHEHDSEKTSKLTLWQKTVAAVRYAFVEMVEDIGKWLVVGLVVAAMITVLVPDELFACFAGNTWLSMLLVLAISVPMYVCATGSIPIAVALMLKGLTPGAALVMLMAGPAANMASVLVVRNRLGARVLVAYVVSIIAGAVAFGTVIDYLLPREWFTSALVSLTHGTEIVGWWQWACTAFLALLLLNALVNSLRHHKHHH